MLLCVENIFDIYYKKVYLLFLVGWQQCHLITSSSRRNVLLRHDDRYQQCFYYMAYTGALLTDAKEELVLHLFNQLKVF